MREQLIRYAVYFEGDYSRIKKAVETDMVLEETIPLQQAVTIVDEQYPKQLLKLARPPYVLFYQGDLTLLKPKAIAVVGSRNASEYGKACTIDVVNRIKGEYVIISGMAKGIDTVAHRYASKTIGILGNGLDVHYPSENEKAYDYMAAKQLLISEYPEKVKPAKHHFPRRNQLISALADKVVVTQAAVQSGTMLTVKEAKRLGKQIYVVPYPYFDGYGLGCNHLIGEGAQLLTSENVEFLLCEDK